MIKVVHTADLHIGVESYGQLDPELKINGRVLDYIDALDSVIDFAEENEADLFIIAGDVFHIHNPQPTYLTLFAERVRRISELCTLIIVVGNHDMPGSVDKSSSVDIFQALSVPNVIIGREYEIHQIETKNGIIQVCTFPYPFKTRFITAKEFSKLSREDIESAYRKRLSSKLKKLAMGIEPGIPSILAAHMAVSGSMLGSEAFMSMHNSGDAEVEDMMYWDYVALGHIHYRQNLTEGIDNATPVVYPGSLERVDFGEEDHEKSFVWAEFDSDGLVSYEHIGIDARKYKTIRVHARKKDDVMAKVLAEIDKYDLQDAVVKVIIDNISFGFTVGKELISQHLKSRGVYYVYSIVTNYKTRISRLPAGGSSIASKSQYELVNDYLTSLELSKSEISDLLSLADGIMEG